MDGAIGTAMTARDLQTEMFSRSRFTVVHFR